jgi:hypothetical protein
MLTWSSPMMLLTLAQRLVILACLRKMVTFAHWRNTWDGHDDNICVLAVISHSVDDLTPQ